METSRRRRRAYHHGDLAAVILREAARLLEKEGVARLTLRALAGRARVSHTAPYRHFADREALLAALAAEGFAMLGRAQHAAAAAGGLRAMGEAYVCFALDHPQRFRLMFGGEVQISKHAALREIATQTFAGLSGALAAQVPEAQGARDSSIAAWALVHGLAQLLLDERISQAARGSRSREQFVREVLATVRFAARPLQQGAAAPAQSA